MDAINKSSGAAPCQWRRGQIYCPAEKINRTGVGRGERKRGGDEEEGGEARPDKCIVCTTPTASSRLYNTHSGPESPRRA